MVLPVTLEESLPLPQFRGRQPKWEGDGRRSPSPAYRGHEAVGRRSTVDGRRSTLSAPLLSSFMKYRLVFVFVFVFGRGKGARFSHESARGGTAG